MATRKEHLKEADRLLARAAAFSTEVAYAKSQREAAEAHIRMAEALRADRPCFGSTRISRKAR